MNSYINIVLPWLPCAVRIWHIIRERNVWCVRPAMSQFANETDTPLPRLTDGQSSAHHMALIPVQRYDPFFLFLTSQSIKIEGSRRDTVSFSYLIGVIQESGGFRNAVITFRKTQGNLCLT